MGTGKRFGLTSFAKILLSLGCIPSNCWLNILPSQVIERCYLLETFRMTSLSHSTGVLRYYSDNRMCSFLATAEAPCPDEHSAACRYFLSTNRRQSTLNIWRCNAFFTHEPRGPSLPTIIAFHFVTPLHELRPPDLVMIQQLFTDLHD